MIRIYKSDSFTLNLKKTLVHMKTVQKDHVLSWRTSGELTSGEETSGELTSGSSGREGLPW
jgi:hypothetical protein